MSGSEYKLAVFDLDGTLTLEPSLWEYIHVRLGRWSGDAERYQEMFRAGRIDYETFCRLDAAVWEGLSRRELVGLVREVRFCRGAGRLTRYLKGRGLALALISTGLTLLSDLVKERFGFDFAVANELVFDQDRATGEVQIHVPFEGKRDWLVRLMAQFGAAPEQVLVFGDSEGDQGLFDLAGFAVAVNPRSAPLAAAADLVHQGPDLAELIGRLPL